MYVGSMVKGGWVKVGVRVGVRVGVSVGLTVGAGTHPIAAMLAR